MNFIVILDNLKRRCKINGRKIHDLAKNELNKRYGISKQPGKSLNVTTNDTLFTLFRKTADFIYRHGEWTKKMNLQLLEACWNEGKVIGDENLKK
ncbi:hypothetical protein V8V50_10515 [Ligilactobacillus salivarius]